MNTPDTEGLEFEHRARTYYMGCAKHALDLAPLPEFKDAVALLEAYDVDPNDDTREDLLMAYNALVDENTRRDYGYTAVGEFFNGLKHILYQTLFDSDRVFSSSTQYFTEARWCAGRALNCSTPFKDIAARAQRKESEWQNALYKKTFDETE